ncbi:MAG: AraC family transcriptional regulator [Bacteroidetes bacterium]|nr:MAG: AraC family transcriptional regulator [Bacteroidota bacterium]
MMLADTHTLHVSEKYRIIDFRCKCVVCSLSEPEYNNSFAITFIKSGYFEYRVFRNNLEAHTGKVLVSKPGFEHSTFHINNQPDTSTTFEFRADFVEELKAMYPQTSDWFLKNNDIHSIILRCTPEMDYLHHAVLKSLLSGTSTRLQIDEWVMELVDELMCGLAKISKDDRLPDSLRKYHLPTVENAKDFMLKHFHENISLQQVADHCLVSPFHFSRIFKTASGLSPHQYLTGIRLNHAKNLLTTTNLSVGEISFESGFNSIEHFATAYRQRFGMSPSEFRKQIV